MDPRDAVKRPTQVTAELPAGEGVVAADESLVDLSAPPGSEDGSLAALLGEVASAPASLPPIDLAPGEELGTIYRIVRRIGSGGMGVVYLARDLELQRDVAVKVHRAAVGTERLYREAVAMAQLAHPNVVTIHGVGRAGGRLYIAMEYIQGDNLSHWMAAAPRSWRDILDVMLAVGEGLVAAHDAGFVHRDIKPPNILVGLDGRPRLGDFGLVRVAAEGTRPGLAEDERSIVDEPVAPSADLAAAGVADTAVPPSDPASSSRSSSRSSGPIALSRDLTALGTTLGTPAYMAPEQLAGRSVDARADQFAFCVVLYEALYGHRPWHGKTVAELREEIARTGPREPGRRDVPPWIGAALRRGLARDPAARFPDVRALLTRLRTPPRRIRGLIAAAALAALAVAAAVFVLTRGPGPVSCDAAGTPAVVTWGPPARNRIAANYVRLDPQAGPDATNRLATALDAWSLSWQHAAITSCQARGHSWSPAVAAASEQCLKTSIGELRALIARAERGPTLVADASTLPDPDACADPRLLVGNAPAPAMELEGHWKGDFGHLLLRRVGDEMWGVYEHDEGTVRGRLTADGFVGWWCEVPSRAAPGDAGDVEMKVIVDRDGVRAIAGRWRYGAAGEWDDRWDLTRDPSPPSAALIARFDDPATFCPHP